MLTRRLFKPALPLGLLLLSSQAFSAAFVPPAAPVKVWQGPYIGAFIGGAWGDYGTNLDVGTISSTSYFSNQLNINAVNQSGIGSLDQSSFFGGLKAGDDWVWDNFLLGAVVDFGWYSQDGDMAVVDAAYPDASGNSYTLSSSYDSDWLFTLRGRAGFQFNSAWPTRLYATGGMAMTHLEITNTFTDNSSLLGVGTSDDSKTKVGWTVGGGLEFQVTDNISIDAEYLWVDFSSVSSCGTIANTAGVAPNTFISPFVTSASLTNNLVKVGLNLRFDV